MSRVRFCILLLMACPALCLGFPPEEKQNENSDRFFGIEQRVPWTTSRITGSPEPPSPYQTEHLFQQLEFKNPVDLTQVPGTNWMCMTERKGKIFCFPNEQNTAQKEVFFGGADVVDGLKSTYGLAFHPEFKKNRYCYVFYVLEAKLPHGTRVSRFKVKDTSPPSIDPTSETILLEWLSGGHNGGCLKFGPDGFLYISAGDGAAPSPPDGHNTGQDLSDFLSSILRIDVNRTDADKPYAIPVDNPFIDQKNARPEIWAYGLRNPWRMSFDRNTGELWLGDVGWQLWEMVYRIERGGNYGWSIQEGPQSVRPEIEIGPSAILPPIISHPRAEAASVTGGYVYRGKRFPDLVGAYIYGDYVTGKIWSLRHDGSKVTSHQELVDTTFAVISFFETTDGELLFMDFNGGTIHQLIPNKVKKNSSTTFPTRLSQTGLFASVKNHVPTAGVVPFSVNVEQWMDSATAQRFVAIPNKETIELKLHEGRTPPKDEKFPVDTVLVKTISMELEPGNPTSARRLETQILHMQGNRWRGNTGEWNGYTYVWNENQTDATLAPKEGMELDLTIVDSKSPHEKRKQTWRVASRAECYLCHNPWAGYRLGFTIPQLNKKHHYPSHADDQLKTLGHVNIVKLSKSKNKNPTKANTQEKVLPHYVDPFNQSASLDERARSYLHVNCAHCHRFGGGGTAQIELPFHLPLEETKALDVRPTQGTFSIHDAKIIAPGDPFRSTMYYRVSKLGRGRMPYIGSQVVDEQGAALIKAWIQQIKNDTPKNTRPKRTADRQLLTNLKSNASSKSSEQQIQQLLGSTSSGLMLMEAVATRKLSEKTIEQVLSAVKHSSNSQVRDLFERFLPEDQRAKRIGTSIHSKQILSLKGDSTRGKNLFHTAAGLQCKNCHQIEKSGSQVGPDLSHVGKKYNRSQLLENIVQPSKVIEPKYVTYLLETEEGRVFRGLLKEKSPTTVTLIDVQGKEIKIPAKQVSMMIQQKVSIMPELLYRDLTAQQLADLLEYLQSLK